MIDNKTTSKKNTTEYTKYRHVIGFQKSKSYLEYRKAKQPNKDNYEILGCKGEKMFTNYLIMPVNHNFRARISETNKPKFFERHLHQSVNLLIYYATNELKMDLTKFKILEKITPENLKNLIEDVYKWENKDEKP